MKIIVSQNSLKWTERALFTAACGLLGYCAVVFVNTWIFQSRERSQFERMVSNPPLPQERKFPPIVTGGMIGRIEIPRLGVSTIFIEGASDETLQRAVGHIAGTALPGEGGNVGIAGHRDTFFRPLRDIQKGDIITLTTLGGKFNYRVVSTLVASPTEVSVLDPGEGERLTLVSCYPFYFVGSAPDRFIVKAERIV
jgi:sortase A